MTKFNSSTTLQTGNMRVYPFYDSLWVYTDAVIHVPPKINTYILTTLTTPEGDVTTTVSPYINGSNHLVSINGRVV